MPQPLTYPGVYIEEVSSGVRTITGVATSIALFIGWAPRGPTDRAVRISSFADYVRNFGGLDKRALLGYSVRQFFENGGNDAYVLRIAKGAEIAHVVQEKLKIDASSAGKWANQFRVRITPRTNEASKFKLEILDSLTEDSVVESFENLSMDPGDSRFVKAMINGRSAFVTVTTTGTDAPAAKVVKKLSETKVGDDGTVLTPSAAEFHAAVKASVGAGSVTDRIDLYNLACVPGETDNDTIQALQGECRRRRAFLIVDSKETDTVAGLDSALPTQITGANAINSALYFPWPQAPDPEQSDALRSFPPCGFVAGIYARTDAERGVWKAPAGSDASVSGAVALSVPMSDAENGRLNPRAVNCLRTFRVYGNVVWGARTLHGDNERGSEWKYVPVRRMALFLEETLFRNTKWVVFEPNDEPLWAQIRLNIGAFMQGLFRQGAFQGRTPREAYFVKCDRETTTQADINLGIVNIHVGFAPLKPAEFVVIHIRQIAGDIPT